MVEPIRVAVSGAGGQIGYSLVFRVAAGGLFGGDRPVSLSLLETADALPRLEAVRMELGDCAFPLLTDVRIADDPRRAFEGADWVVLLAGSPRHPGQQRSDLIRQNGPIFVDHGLAINDAAPAARVLVVANPCNTNCAIARSHAMNVPDERWFALNRLDRMRATAMIAEKAGVPVAHVSRVIVWGNHSESAYVDVRNAFIGDRPAIEVITDRAWVREGLPAALAHRSLDIITRRGASPAGTAAQAILGTIRSITTPTPYALRFGAAVVSDGSYGVPRGLVFGLPLQTEDGHTWSVVQGLYHDEDAQRRLVANVEELEHEAVLAGEFIA